MLSSQQWSALLFVGTLLGVLVVGSYAGGLAADEPGGDELVEGVLDGNMTFETLRGVRTHEREVQRVDGDGPRTWTTTREVWIRLPDRARRETVASTSNASGPGDVTVINGSTLKRYKSDEERMLIEREWKGGVDRFDTGPRLEDFEAEYVGTETVAGRETYVVEIEPARDASVRAALTLHLADREFDVVTVSPDTIEAANVSYTTTWWIDVETGYPLKERVEYEYDNPEDHPLQRESDVYTTVYENVTFDTEIADDRFTIDPPEGTEVYETAEPLDVDSIAEADATAPFTVPDPSVPERFERILVSGYEFDDDVTVEILYRDGDDIEEDDSIWIRITERPPSHGEEDVRRTDVGDVNGTVVEKQLGTTLSYRCGDVRYEITPDLDAGNEVAVATEVAESTDCS